MVNPVSQAQSSSSSPRMEDAESNVSIFRKMIPLCGSNQVERWRSTAQLPQEIIDNIAAFTFAFADLPEPSSSFDFQRFSFLNPQLEPHYQRAVRRVVQLAFLELNNSSTRLRERMHHYMKEENVVSFLESESDIVEAERTQEFLNSASLSMAEWITGELTTCLLAFVGKNDENYLLPLWSLIHDRIFVYLKKLSCSDAFLRSFVARIVQKDCRSSISGKDVLGDVLKKIMLKDNDFFKTYLLNDPAMARVTRDSKKNEVMPEFIKEAKSELLQYIYSQALLIAIHPDESQRDDSLLIEILRLCREYILDPSKFASFNELLPPQDLKALPIQARFIEMVLMVLQSGGIDFLRKSPKEFDQISLSPLRSHSPIQLVNAAQTNYALHSSFLTFFYFFWKLGYSVVPQYFIPRQGIDVFRNFHDRQINQKIQTCEKISPEDRTVLQLLLSRVSNRLTNNYRNTSEVFQQFASGDSLSLFYSIFNQRFDFSKLSSPGVSKKERKLAIKYKEHYENYIPRLKQLSLMIRVFSDQNARDLFILRTFCSFLEQGDVNRLIKEISRFNSAARQDTILYTAIEDFASTHVFDKSQEVINKGYQGIEMQCVDTPKLLAGLLDILMFDDKPCLEYLFNPVSTSSASQPVATDSELLSGVGRNKRKKKKKQQNPQRVSAPTKQNVLPTVSRPAQEILESKKIAPVSSSSSQSLSPGGSVLSPMRPSSSLPEVQELQIELENNRVRLSNWLQNLNKGQNPHIADALKNSYEHYDNLLCSMRCLKSEASGAKMTPQLLFAFVNDCIRYSTLGTEQLLTALYQKTRKVDKELPLRLTHDLEKLLIGCLFIQTDIPYSLRKWIEEINGGEIIVRNRQFIPERKTLLTTLLNANYQLLDSQEVSTESRAILFKALFNYLEPLGKFLDAMQEQFLVAEDVHGELGQGFSEFVGHFCQMMSSYPLAQRPIAESSSSKTLSELRSQLEISNSSQLSQMIGELDNVLTNSLVHLEASVRNDLEPIETSLRLRNALLLNQQIVESVLLHRVHSARISTTDEEQCQHNLPALLNKLGITEKDFPMYFSLEEIEFLKTARACRQLIRYPASFRQLSSQRGRLRIIEEHLKASRRLAATQAAGQDLRGFTPVKGSDKEGLKKIEAMIHKDTQTMASIVNKVLSLETIPNPK